MCSGPSTTITMGAQRCKGHSQQGCHHYQLAGGDSCARLQGRAAQHAWIAGLGLISPLAPQPCVLRRRTAPPARPISTRSCTPVPRSADPHVRARRATSSSVLHVQFSYAACSGCSKAGRKSLLSHPRACALFATAPSGPLPLTQTSNPNPRIIWRLHRSQDGQPLCLPASCFQRRLRGPHLPNGAVVHRDQLQERPCQHVLPEHSPEHYVVQHCTVRTNASDS